MLGGVFLPFFRPLDFIQLVIDRLALPVKARKLRQPVQLLDALPLIRKGGFQTVNGFAVPIQPGFQIGQGADIVGVQIIDGCAVTFQIAQLGFLTPCPGVASRKISPQQINNKRLLRFREFCLYLFEPCQQLGNCLANIVQLGISGAYPAVEIALVGADALCLHRPDGGTLTLGRNLIYALTGKAAMVDAAAQSFFGKLLIAHLSPRLPPRFQCLRLAPICCGNGVEHVIACLIQNALPMLIQHIFPPLLIAPSAVFIQRTDGAHSMKVGIGNAAVLLVWLMHSKVCHHAPAHKIVRQKLPCKVDVLLHGG